MIWESLSELPKPSPDQNIQIVYGTGKQLYAEKLHNHLPAEEKERARRIKSEEERNTWTACHALLRQIIGFWLNQEPVEIVLQKNEFGKLHLPNSNLCFNVSHTDKSFLLGFNHDGRIGVDLEYLTGREDVPLLMGYAFSWQETEFCSQENTPENFLKIWTLKEAYLKATGVGLVDYLKSVNVYGYEENEIVSKQLNHNTFICPNGETASVVYRNDQQIDYIWLK